MQSTQELLLEKYLQHQQKHGKKISVKEFSEHIGGPGYKYFSQVFNGRLPSEAFSRHLAEFFDDLRFLDAEGIPRPDPRLHSIIANWPRLSEDARNRISDEVETYKTRE